MASIHFFNEDIDFTPQQKGAMRSWITDAVKTEGFRLGELNFIFCSDEYLLNINKTYLEHDTYTDIVTFDHSDTEDRIVGDLFISIDRVRDNARAFEVSERDELHRVMVHGVMHLCGYGDHSPGEKEVMTNKENTYLARRPLFAIK